MMTLHASRRTLSRLCALLIVLFMVTACEEKKPGLGKYGMLDENTPEYAAVTFMYSIYQANDLDQAVQLSTDQLANILRSYHTTRNVQRHLLNLPFDSVTITPQGSSKIGRSEFADKATLTLFFSGELRGDKREDIRSVELVRIKGNWRVNDIHPDHFF